MILKFKKHPNTISTVAFTVYVVMTFLGVFVFHEPWRDEFQIWMIATESNSLSELSNNYKAEEHPKLWFYMLYFLSCISHSIVIKQLFTWVLSTIAAGLILWKSPFTQLQKVLLVFGYYLLFEYTQMSRVYSLELLLLTSSFCFFKTGTFRWNIAITLCLLAQTTLLGATLSGVLLLYSLFTVRPLKEYIYQYGLVLLGFGIALTNAISGTLEWGYVETISWQQTTYDLNWFSAKIATFNNGFLPVPNVFNFHFWNTHIIDTIVSFYAKTFITISIALALLTGIIISFWKEKRLIWMYFIGAIPMFILFALLWHGCTRHHGHFFLLYLTCHFILMKNGNTTNFSTIFLSSVLLIQLPGGIYAYYQDMNHEFSNGKETASLITLKYTEYDAYTGTFDYTMTPVSYYTGRPFYVPESKDNIRFIKWSKSHFYTSDNEALQDLILDITTSTTVDFGQQVLIVKSQPIYSAQLEYNGQELFQLLQDSDNSFTIGNWQLSHLASTKKAIVKEEGYHIFELIKNNLHEK